MHHAPTTAYLRWVFLRAALWRGYWTVTAVYLVVVADLSPTQLVLIGAFQAMTNVVAELPAGVLADTVSRRLSVAVSHVVRGGGMVLAGSVTSFPLLVASQGLCGLGWAFSSGADVAWITDELDDPPEADRVLAAQARWELLGEPVGVLAVAALAWATTLATAIVASGVAMTALALLVRRWPERGFVPADPASRWLEAAAVARRGIRLARAERVVLAVLVATALVNGGYEVFGRVRERLLLERGMPTDPDPIVWFAALAAVGVTAGAATLRLVERHVAGAGVARRTYVAASAVCAGGIAVFAYAPVLAAAVPAVVVVSGVAAPVVRASGTIWVNQRVTSDVRATVHSLVSQAEHAGELVLGVALALLASTTSTTVALSASAGLVALAAAVAVRRGRGRAG